MSTAVTSELDLRQQIRFKETQLVLFGVGSGTDPTAEQPQQARPSSPGERDASREGKGMIFLSFSAIMPLNHGILSYLCLYIWCRCKQGGAS